jgi:hypothetical protein
MKSTSKKKVNNLHLFKEMMKAGHPWCYMPVVPVLSTREAKAGGL